MTSAPEVTQTLEEAVSRLFGERPVPEKLLDTFLRQLQENLIRTESLLNRNYFEIVLFASAFILLDTSTLADLSLFGNKLSRSGPLLAALPVLIAALTCLALLRVHMVHEMRTVLALAYREINPSFYENLLDVLLHHPSFRNSESYLSRYARTGAPRTISTITTWTVAVLMTLSIPLFEAYALYRCRLNTDISLGFWLASLVLSVMFLARAFVQFDNPRNAGAFSERKVKATLTRENPGPT